MTRRRWNRFVAIALVVIAPGQFVLSYRSVDLGFQTGDALLVAMGLASAGLFGFVLGAKLDRLARERP